MKIEEYLATLPKNIISGQDVQLPDVSIREICKFANVGCDDVFVHLGCGDGNSLVIASEEFGAKQVIGIDNNKAKIETAEKLLEEKRIQNSELICQDILDSDLSEATVILFWFADDEILEKMMEKFQKLKNGCRIVTLWGPLPECLPEKVDFPYILNKIPFRYANDLKEQLLSIFGVKCVDFVTAWEHAERYTKAIGSPDAKNDRFLTIIQTLVIWINAKNLGVACGEDIPLPIKTYIGILRNYFNIEVEHLLK